MLAANILRGLRDELRRTLDNGAQFETTERMRVTKQAAADLEFALAHLLDVTIHSTAGEALVRVKIDTRRHIPRSRRLNNAVKALCAIADNDTVDADVIGVVVRNLERIRFPQPAQVGKKE